MSYKVELAYFKQSGKYYTNAFYQSDKEHLFEVFSEVQKLLDRRVLPGLCKNHSPYYVVIDVPSHNHDYPHMCIPETWAESDVEPERAPEVCTIEEWEKRILEKAGSPVSCYVCFPEVKKGYSLRVVHVPEKLCIFHLLLKVYEKIENIDAHTSIRRPM